MQTSFDYYTDDRRERGKRGDLFNLLADEQWHSSWELLEAGGLGFHTSIHHFRQAGFDIEADHLGDGLWRYRLAGRGETVKRLKRMTRPQALVAQHYDRSIHSTLGSEALEAVFSGLPNWMQIRPGLDGWTGSS